ncbi:zf-RVT domain-containing protein, partial [Cephalotus follicularis]
VDWFRVVWFLNSIPKHSFCVCLTFNNMHKTLDRLSRLGVFFKSNYVFGCGEEESINHLFFFACKATSEVWNHFLALCGFVRKCLRWELESRWCVRKLRGNSCWSRDVPVCHEVA